MSWQSYPHSASEEMPGDCRRRQPEGAPRSGGPECSGLAPHVQVEGRHQGSVLTPPVGATRSASARGLLEIPCTAQQLCTDLLRCFVLAGPSWWSPPGGGSIGRAREGGLVGVVAQPWVTRLDQGKAINLNDPRLPIEALRSRIVQARQNPLPLTGRLRGLVDRHNFSRSTGKSISKVVVADGRLVDIRDTGEHVTVSKITTEVFS